MVVDNLSTKSRIIISKERTSNVLLDSTNTAKSVLYITSFIKSGNDKETDECLVLYKFEENW